MPYFICYDIENDRLRDKAAKKLAYFGLLRIQKSVFAGPLGRSHLKKLEQWFRNDLVPLLQPDDKIAILQIDNDNFAATQHLNYVPEGWDELIDPPVALIL